jgi:hypothetical protein
MEIGTSTTKPTIYGKQFTEFALGVFQLPTAQQHMGQEQARVQRVWMLRVGSELDTIAKGGFRLFQPIEKIKHACQVVLDSDRPLVIG